MWRLEKKKKNRGRRGCVENGPYRFNIHGEITFFHSFFFSFCIDRFAVHSGEDDGCPEKRFGPYGGGRGWG